LILSFFRTQLPWLEIYKTIAVYGGILVHSYVIYLILWTGLYLVLRRNSGTNDQGDKKLEERATEYAKDIPLTEKFLTKIVEDSLLIVSTSASEKEDNESKNNMMTLADSIIISTSSVNVGSDKPLRNFNESIAGFYANLIQ
jgi:hypothetical protein